MKLRKILLWVIGVLLILGLLGGGGFAAYRYGYTQGVAQSPAVAEAIQQSQKNGSAEAPYFHHGFDGPQMRGGGFPMRESHFGFFPLGGLVGFLFVAFLFVGLARLVFGPPWGWRWQRGPHAPQPETPSEENK